MLLQMAVYFSVLVYCAYTDVRYGLIKNHAVLGLIFFGLFVTNGVLSDLIGGSAIFEIFRNLFVSVLWLLGISVFGFFVLVKIMAPGDAKLFIGIGSVIGMASMLDVLLFSLLWAIVLFFVTSPRKIFAVLKRVIMMFYNLFLTKQIEKISPENSMYAMPYAVCVLLAAITSYALGNRFLIDHILMLWV